MTYELVMKPTFTNQLCATPAKFMAQIMEKIEVLRDDPSPHEPLKKKLHGVKSNLYRLRSGDFRIIYTYGNGFVTLIGVDDRKDVYKGDLLVADLPTISAQDVPSLSDLLAPTAPTAWQRPSGERMAPQAAPLPRPIDLALLEALRVPAAFHHALLGCTTVDDLCAIDVPDTVRSAVFDTVTTPDYEQALVHQPDLVVPDVNDLLRYKEGELLGFLLRLSPAQEKFVTWGLGATGPTLVKGGPGSGKSTVALYRVRELIRQLRASGVAQPRILFTTFTNALATYTRQLLTSLLGDDIDCVDVRNYDKLVTAICAGRRGGVTIANTAEQRGALKRALRSVEFTGNALEQKAQRTAIERMDEGYLLEELDSVITARQLTMLAMYRVTPRVGRRVAFNATQRQAVWTVYECYVAELAKLGKLTWQQAHAEAERIVRFGGGPEVYDAVVVDEAQDLDPSVLRMLVALCRAPNRFFVTADANQSIYGSGFNWDDVHADLKFRGRTGVLRTNYRSTREIGEAAHAYLAGGALDAEGFGERDYVHDGPMPAVRAVASGGAECELLARYLPDAARMFQLGRGSCAVLTPSNDAGKAIAAELTSRGVKATFMTGNDLDLRSNDVKVLNLKSAKGLEFPVVALAGFINVVYPQRTSTMQDEEWEELLARERRTVFVGMTRAMRALFVSIPDKTTSSLLTGFTPTYWNLGATETQA